jgi:hypothetical protein
MPKMTPEQEARYALDFNVARNWSTTGSFVTGVGVPKEEEMPDAIFPALGVQVRGDTVESMCRGTARERLVR